MPARNYPSAMMPDQDGGWIVLTSEQISGKDSHSSIWGVDREQNGRRLLCLPWPARALLMGVTASPQHSYFALLIMNREHDTVSAGFYRFPRTPAR